MAILKPVHLRNRWVFSSSEFISLNQTDSCGVIPTEFTAIQNLTVHVRKGCVQFYSNNDCSGEDVQLLVTYDTRELTQRGFRSPVRSFSHCNSKCINKISVRNAEGRRILEDEPGGVGFRLVYESGNRGDVSDYILNLYKCYNTFEKDDSRVLRVGGYGLCLVLYPNNYCNRYPTVYRPTIFFTTRLDSINVIDFSNRSDFSGVKSVMPCSEVSKSEAHSATVSEYLPPSSEILEITVFDLDDFKGEDFDFSTTDCLLLPRNNFSIASMDTHHSCVTLFTGLNCTGKSNILFPGSPVLRHFNLLKTHGQIQSLRKCRDEDHLRDNGPYSFTMTTHKFEYSSWTINSTNSNYNKAATCWEIPFYYRSGGVRSVIVHEGCIQIYRDINCSPYAQSVRIRPNFDASDLERWNFDDFQSHIQFGTPIGSFSKCNFNGGKKMVWKEENQEWENHPDRIVLLFKSGITQSFMQIISCEPHDRNHKWAHDSIQLVTSKTACVYVFNDIDCKMEPPNLKPYLLNITDTEGIILTNFSQSGLWSNPKYVPKSVVTCSAYSWAQTVARGNLENDFGTNITKESSNVLLYVGIPVIILVAIGTIAFALIMRNSSRKRKLCKSEIDAFYNGSDAVSANNDDAVQNMAVNREYELLPKDFIWANSNSEDKSPIVLGRGTFGVVVQGVLHKGFDEVSGLPIIKDVAIKMPRIGVTIEQIRALLAEIKINMFVGKHPHIVEFLGFCIAEVQRRKVSIILELCENGSLLKYVRDHAKQFEKGGNANVANPPEDGGPNYENMECFNRKKLVTWCKEIAKGMDFLANNKVLHGDLAARNCLLDGQLSIKITDFGLSRKLYDYGNYVKKGKALLPWRWMSLESLKLFQFSVKSDVWSYGVTMWEIFSFGGLPYPTLTWNDYFIESLTAGLRLSPPTNCPDELVALMQSCWLSDPDQRPDFSQLENAITQYVQTVE
ncbi:vascular endothelial growth factor receptor 2-like [Folsomia candida]|uniref:vascular endothelial growth factor receptor 2-like n=1 Tax=Folsomia candida TaxID=158441 RepID=UPI00160548CE|nr:vascular endothelial growth factor receptor 2-like [Folsomia candida]